jgi:hypothetical protein
MYSASELAVMLEDILIFKDFGVAGLVLGVLQPNGKIDVEHTQLSGFASCPDKPILQALTPYLGSLKRPDPWKVSRHSKLFIEHKIDAFAPSRSSLLPSCF